MPCRSGGQARLSWSQDGQRIAYRLACGDYHDRVQTSERAGINMKRTLWPEMERMWIDVLRPVSLLAHVSRVWDSVALAQTRGTT